MIKDLKKYSKPLVSVILTSYNRANYIKKAISSVLNQSYKNFELIIVNDSSTDNTLNIISSYKDPRIRIINNEKNIGFVRSLNKAISFSKGQYIARIDDDDIWSGSRKLEKQIRFLENNLDYVLVGSGKIIIGKDKMLFPEKDKDIRKRIIIADLFVHSSVVFRKQAFDKVGGYDETCDYSQDWDLWLKLGRIGKFYNFQEYMVSCKEGSHNRCSKNLRYHLLLNNRIRKKYKNDYPNFYKGWILGWLYYFFPFRNNILFTKFKKIILK